MRLGNLTLIRETKELSDLLYESLYNVRVKNAQGISDEFWAQLVSFDPTLNIQNPNDETELSNSPEGYMRWILKMSKNKTLDPSKVKDLLKQFNSLKNKKGLLKSNDINQYKSTEELENAIKEALPKLTANQKNKQAKRDAKELSTEKKPGMYMNGAVELLFNGNDWEVWTPHTYEGSKALRRGAVWCTGGDSPSFYNHYTEDGELYVIINKKDPEEKYQLFVPAIDIDSRRSREFRDKHNGEMQFRKFVHENKELLDFFLTLDDVTNSYPNLDDPSVDDEWTDEKEEEIYERYNIRYLEDTYEIGLGYSTYYMTRDCKYIDQADLETLIENGYGEGLSGYKINDYYNECIQAVDFVDYIDWQDTRLQDLYDEFIEETKENVEFKDFLYTLFGTKGKEEIKSVDKWLTDKRNEYWRDDVYSSITKYAFDDAIWDNVYGKLKMFGWNPEKPKTSLNGSLFLVRLEDCHTVQQFYEEYTDNGRKTYDQVVDEVIGNGLDLSYAEDVMPDYSYAYAGNYLHKDDAEQIYDLF